MRIIFDYHSMVDVITNSSTTIYTDSSNCIGPAKELVTEFLKTLGVDGDVNDMFGFAVFYVDYCYTDYSPECECEGLCECEDHPFKGMSYEEQRNALDSLLEQIGRGEIDRPEWFNKAEQRFDNYEYDCDSMLSIFPKGEKYKALGKALNAFLYSTGHEAGYN